MDERGMEPALGAPLLADILGETVMSTSRGPVVEALNLFHIQNTHAPDLLKDADDDLANIAFSVEEAWVALSRVWADARGIFERVRVDQTALLKRPEWADRDQLPAAFQEAEERSGQAEVVNRVETALLHLAAEYRRLPIFGPCETCGSVRTIG